MESTSTRLAKTGLRNIKIMIFSGKVTLYTFWKKDLSITVITATFNVILDNVGRILEDGLSFFENYCDVSLCMKMMLSHHKWWKVGNT